MKLIAALVFVFTILRVDPAFADEVITPNPHRGNFALEAPGGLPQGLDGRLWVLKVVPPNLTYEISLSEGLTLPVGRYLVSSHRPNGAGYPVTINPGQKTVLKVSAIFSTRPLSLANEVFTVNWGQGGPLGTRPFHEIDRKHPFVVLFPGEEAVPVEDIYTGSPGFADVNPHIVPPAKRTSLHPIDDQLANFEVKLPPVDPELPDYEPIHVCSQSCFKLREIPNGKFSMSLNYPHWRSETLYFEFFESRPFEKEYTTPGNYELTLKRLGVRHIVGKEGGKPIAGKYSIFKGSRRIVSGFKTQTAVDLPEGHYVVEISGKDEAGKEYFETKEVDL